MFGRSLCPCIRSAAAGRRCLTNLRVLGSRGILGLDVHVGSISTIRQWECQTCWTLGRSHSISRKAGQSQCFLEIQYQITPVRCSMWGYRILFAPSSARPPWVGFSFVLQHSFLLFQAFRRPHIHPDSIQVLHLRVRRRWPAWAIGADYGVGSQPEPTMSNPVHDTLVYITRR